jgi:hypothetical protein
MLALSSMQTRSPTKSGLWRCFVRDVHASVLRIRAVDPFLEIGSLLSGSIAAGARLGYMAALPCIDFIAWQTGNVVLAGIFVLMVALAIAGALAANWHSITG